MDDSSKYGLVVLKKLKKECVSALFAVPSADFYLEKCLELLEDAISELRQENISL